MPFLGIERQDGKLFRREDEVRGIFLKQVPDLGHVGWVVVGDKDLALRFQDPPDVVDEVLLEETVPCMASLGPGVGEEDVDFIETVFLKDLGHRDTRIAKIQQEAPKAPLFYALHELLIAFSFVLNRNDRCFRILFVKPKKKIPAAGTYFQNRGHGEYR